MTFVFWNQAVRVAPAVAVALMLGCAGSSTGGSGGGGGASGGAGGGSGSDAGPADAGPADAGTADAGTADAGATDAGTADAGATDAGTADAGTADAGVVAVIYPAPSGEAPSPKFEVRVMDGSGLVRSAFVYFDPARQVTTPGNPGTDLQTGRSFNWTTFEISGPVKVRVTRLAGPFTNVRLRPTRYGLTPQAAGPNTIEFTMSPGQKVSVESEGDFTKCYYGLADCVRDILTVFADPMETVSPIAGYAASDIFRPAPGLHAANATVSGITAPVASLLGNANNKKVVVFDPGVYVIGYWEVPNTVEHIHLMGGALVYGAINVLPMGAPPLPDDYLTTSQFTLRSAFKLTGHGVLSGQKIPWHMTQDFGYCPDDTCGWWKMARLLRLNVAAITLSDLTFVNSPYWTIALANDADSRSTGTMRGFKVLGQWAYNNDGLAALTNGQISDCFVQTNDDGIKLTQSGTRIDRCVMWQFSNGGSFQLGWYPKTISNVEVKNIDLIHAEWWWGAGDNSGLLSYGTSGGNGLISGISFSDVNIEDKALRLVGLFPRSGQQIANLHFTRVKVDAWGNDLFNSGRFNILSGDDGGTITNVAFDGLTVGGQPVTNANAATVGRFQQTGNVTQVTFGP